MNAAEKGISLKAALLLGFIKLCFYIMIFIALCITLGFAIEYFDCHFAFVFEVNQLYGGGSHCMKLFLLGLNSLPILLLYTGLIAVTAWFLFFLLIFLGGYRG